MKNGNLVKGIVIVLVGVFSTAWMGNEVYQTTTINSIQKDVALLGQTMTSCSKEHAEMKLQLGKVGVKVDTLEHSLLRMKLTTLKQ